MHLESNWVSNPFQEHDITICPLFPVPVCTVVMVVVEVW